MTRVVVLRNHFILTVSLSPVCVPRAHAWFCFVPRGRGLVVCCVRWTISVINFTFLPVFQLYQQGRLCQLGGEFCELEVFAKVLRASDKRYLTMDPSCAVFALFVWYTV